MVRVARPSRRIQGQGEQAIKTFGRMCGQGAGSLRRRARFTLVLGVHSLGKIDRIGTLPDGTVAVFDYKTGQAKEELGAEDKEQLHLYQVALRRRGSTFRVLCISTRADWVITDVDLLKAENARPFSEKYPNAWRRSRYPISSRRRSRSHANIAISRIFASLEAVISFCAFYGQVYKNIEVWYIRS